MSGAAIPDGALAGIPGWEQASFEWLDGGRTNDAWLVDNGEQKAVLKIDTAPRPVPFTDRAAEARTQQRAAGAGLAANVLFASATVLLAEYLEGLVWTRSDLDDDDNLVRLADALKRLHAMPLSGRRFDAPAAARRYFRSLAGGWDGKAREWLATVESMPEPASLACCHNDLVVSNIISAPDVRFLDWEYACDNDPLFDLATVIAHHGLPGRKTEILLDAYFEGASERWRDRLAVQERLYEALHGLWSAAVSRSE